MDSGEETMKFKKKMVNRIKAIREEENMTQQKLTKKIGVSRQTIYYLEKNDYNPSLEIIRKLMKVLDKKFEEIFYEVPVIKELIENLSVKEVKEIAEKVGISDEQIISLTKIDDKDLNKNFKKEVLEKLALELGVKFEDVFEND